MALVDSFIAIDLETTGLKCGSDKIMEIALIKYENGIDKDKFTTLINPGVAISESVTGLTGIDADMVKDAPYISDVIDEVWDFIGNDILVGHNLMFDYSFLKKAMVNSGKSFEKYGIDTLKLARILLTDLEHKNLDYVCRYFDIKDDNHHRAFNDARAAAELLYKLYDKFGEEHDDLFKAGKLEFKVKKEGPITAHQLERIRGLLKKHGIEPDYEPEKLTKNEASRKIDKIYLQYGRL
ncbi:MAG: hypothetical protein E7266_02275 [Lachnospiraceae bacterium]|nr:hypothetical protein [Lachnospiraceae bacterium]